MSSKIMYQLSFLDPHQSLRIFIYSVMNASLHIKTPSTSTLIFSLEAFKNFLKCQ